MLIKFLNPQFHDHNHFKDQSFSYDKHKNYK